jgi:hypothetical protein
MNMLKYPGKERPWLQRLKGAAATFIIDSILWVLLVLLAVGGALGRSGALFVVAMTGGFLVVGLFFGLYAKKQNDRPFLQGVIIATSLVLLLDVTCWGTLGLR